MAYTGPFLYFVEGDYILSYSKTLYKRLYDL